MSNVNYKHILIKIKAYNTFISSNLATHAKILYYNRPKGAGSLYGNDTLTRYFRLATG